MSAKSKAGKKRSAGRAGPEKPAVSVAPKDNLERLFPFLILACCLLAYIPAYAAGFIWDDDDYVFNNPVLRNPDGLRQIWLDPTSLPQYYPMVHSLFWLEFRLWDVNPMGYHVVNVVLHAVNAMLVFRILKNLSVPGASFAALLFAVHPVHVESVAWITERKNVLSGLFYLLSLGTYLRWRPVASAKPAGVRFGILAFVLFLAALASKSVTCSLPAVVLLLVYWKRGGIAKADWIRTVPFFAVGLAYAFYTAFLEQSHVKAVGEAFDLNFMERVLIAGRACWFYLGKLAVPFPLMFNYPRWSLDPSSVVQWLFPVAFLALVIGLFVFRKKLGRGPLVAQLFFCGTLLPALGFFNTYPMRYSFVADHFQYLASLGPLALFAAGCSLAVTARTTKAVRSVAAGLVLLVPGMLTFQQAKAYKSHEAIWRDTLKKNPRSWIAMNNLAKMLIDRGGEEEQARGLLERSLNLTPTAVAHTNLGVLDYAGGDLDKALDHFNQGIALEPDQAAAYNDKAFILMTRDSLDEALRCVNRALELDTLYPDAVVTRGWILYKLGRMKEAYADLSLAMQWKPGKRGSLIIPVMDAAFQSGDLNNALNWGGYGVKTFRDNPDVQALFSKILIQAVTSQDPEKKVPVALYLYNTIGAAAEPGFVKLLEYMRNNGMGSEADQIGEVLNR